MKPFLKKNVFKEFTTSINFNVLSYVLQLISPQNCCSRDLDAKNLPAVLPFTWVWAVLVVGRWAQSLNNLTESWRAEPVMLKELPPFVSSPSGRWLKPIVQRQPP